MSDWFCPLCSAEVQRSIIACPVCGADLKATDAASYEQKLIWALDHRLPDRRLMAARILGERRSRAAATRLTELVGEDVDPYLKAEAIRALGCLGDPEALQVVRDAAVHGVAIVRAAAREILDTEHAPS